MITPLPWISNLLLTHLSAWFNLSKRQKPSQQTFDAMVSVLVLVCIMTLQVCTPYFHVLLKQTPWVSSYKLLHLVLHTKKPIFTSIWWFTRLWIEANATNNRMVVVLATTAYVSKWSISCFCRKPCATKQALNLLIVPSILIFFRKIYLQPIGLQDEGKSTNTHILFPMMESISSLIASLQK